MTKSTQRKEKEETTMFNDFDLLLIRQGADLVPGDNLTDQEIEHVQRDWAAWGNQNIDQDGNKTWLVAFANRRGDFLEITNTREIPRSVDTQPQRPQLRVIAGGATVTVDLEKPARVTIDLQELNAA